MSSRLRSIETNGSFTNQSLCDVNILFRAWQVLESGFHKLFHLFCYLHVTDTIYRLILLTSIGNQLFSALTHIAPEKFKYCPVSYSRRPISITKQMGTLLLETFQKILTHWACSSANFVRAFSNLAFVFSWSSLSNFIVFSCSSFNTFITASSASLIT